MGFMKILRVRTYRMTFRRNGEALSKTLMLVRMYTAKERETLVIETAHSSRLGCFDVHGLLKKGSVDIGCRRMLTQNSFVQMG